MVQVYGKWMTEKELKPGGQAHTFLVRNTDDLSRPLHVLKRLKNPKQIARFSKEVKAGLSLAHPNLLKIVDYSLEGEKPYFVAEYCDGGELTFDRIASWSYEAKLKVFLGICRGVGYAHGKGITHRDIKPANIFFKTDGTPVVGDFGICYYDDGANRVTLVDEVVGTFYYISPELEKRFFSEVGPPSDVYSLGKLLYWMLSGKNLPREQHRERPFDLTFNNNDPYLSLIYNVLDSAFVVDPFRRLGDGNILAERIEHSLTLIEKGAHVLDAKARQECTFCKDGEYQVVDANLKTVHGGRLVKHYGLNIEGEPHWLFLICQKCGHIQYFRLDGDRSANWRNLAIPQPR